VVRGKVIASDTNSGVAGATIELRRQPSGTLTETRCDASGEFTLTSVPSGEYLVTARRIGYGPVNYSVTTPRGRQSTIQVKEGDVQNVAMRLMPLGTVEGVVYGPDNAPMAGARVALSHYHAFLGKRVLMPEREVITGQDGTFRVVAVPSGEYFVSAFYRGLPGPISAASLPVYYPGVASIKNAKKIDVVLGRPTKDIKMLIGAPAAAGGIRGRVVDTTGAPVAGASVILRRETEDGTWSLLSSDSVSVKAGAAGEFAASGLLLGNYHVLASSSNNEPKLVAHATVALSTAALTDLTVVAEPHATVSGRIILADSKEKVDLRIARVGVRSEANAGTPGLGSAVVAKDGTFRAENIFEGPARIEVSTLRQGFFVKSIKRHGQELGDHTLTINKGEKADGIEVVISFAPAQLSGMVSSGREVVLFPADAKQRRERPDLTKVAAVGANGQYLIRGIAPGEYRIAGLRSPVTNIETDHVTLTSLESRAGVLTLAAGQQQVVNLEGVDVEHQ